MKFDEFSNPQHLCVISCSAGIKALNDSRYITENAGVHQSLNKKIWLGKLAEEVLFPRDSHPTNMTQIVKIFSASVFGATLPNPTDVRDVNVKYKAVT